MVALRFRMSLSENSAAACRCSISVRSKGVGKEGSEINISYPRGSSLSPTRPHILSQLDMLSLLIFCLVLQELSTYLLQLPEKEQRSPLLRCHYLIPVTRSGSTLVSLSTEQVHLFLGDLDILNILCVVTFLNLYEDQQHLMNLSVLLGPVCDK